MTVEIWTIRCGDGFWWDEDGTHGFMAWPSREQAEQGLAYQREHYACSEGVLELVCLGRVNVPEHVSELMLIPHREDAHADHKNRQTA